MHARGRGSDYEKSERMKMDPRDTVKLRASLVTRRDTEMYSGTPLHRRNGRLGEKMEMEGGKDGKKGSKKWMGGKR